MKILVIGSKGFIGRHVHQYFLEKFPDKVCGADVIVDYTATNYFLIDASNADFHNIFRENQFDFCINCSGAASVSDSISNPARDYHLNTHNVFKMLEAVRQFNPTCKVITLSSAAVYGNPASLPIDESFKSHPISPYGWHKLQSELLCREYHEQFKISTVCLRIFSVYGPGLKKQLFWDLYKKSKKGGKVSLWGTGEESRDFIYIKDFLEVVNLIIENAEFKGQIINVANGEEIFIKDAVRLFYDNFDDKVEYEFAGNNRPGDPNNWLADISVLKSLGYKRKDSFAAGLQEYYKWIKGIEKE